MITTVASTMAAMVRITPGTRTTRVTRITVGMGAGSVVEWVEWFVFTEM